MNKKDYLFPHEKVIECSCKNQPPFVPKDKEEEIYATKEFAFLHPCHNCDGSGLVIDPATMLCNSCGESMLPKNVKFDHQKYPLGMYKKRYSGRYESWHLFDCTTYYFSICELCLRNMFSSFKIPPSISGMGEDISYEEDNQYYQKRLWQASIEYKEAVKNGYCNALKGCTNKAVYTFSTIKGDFSYNVSCEEHTGLVTMYANSHKYKFIPFNLKSFL